MTSVAREVFIAFATQDRKSAKAASIVWTLVVVLLVALAANIRTEPERLIALRILLLLLAAGEAGGAVAQGLLTRPFTVRDGCPDVPAYYGVRQDFALYNGAMSALLFLTAVDPIRYVAMVNVAVVLYTIHGVTHVLRYVGVLTSRTDTALEIKQGLPLIVAALGLLMFHP